MTLNMAEDIDALARLCEELGLPFSRLAEDVRQRLRLLAEHSETVRDAHRIVQLAHAVFDHCARNVSAEPFDELERRIVLIGSVFADIGKTGPPHATEAQQRMIVEMFDVEGVRDEQQPVEQFFSEHFTEDASDRARCFASLGLDTRMSIRSFWNLHAGWTLEIARRGGLPDEAVAAAATHHMFEGVNPANIVGDDSRG